MNRKSKIQKYTRVCQSCGKNTTFYSQLGEQDITAKMVAHYEDKHPDRMSYCFDQYGRTWNAQYDACLKALHHTTTQRDAAIKERDAAAAQQRTLAAKLNAIVLVMRND